MVGFSGECKQQSLSFFLEPDNRFSSPAQLSAKQMQAIQLVCSMARRKVPSASIRHQFFVFFFSCLQIIQAARRNEEECYNRATEPNSSPKSDMESPGDGPFREKRVVES